MIKRFQLETHKIKGNRDVHFIHTNFNFHWSISLENIWKLCPFSGHIMQMQKISKLHKIKSQNRNTINWDDLLKNWKLVAPRIDILKITLIVGCIWIINYALAIWILWFNNSLWRFGRCANWTNCWISIIVWFWIFFFCCFGNIFSVTLNVF